jgi:ubiquinone biosynthesis protein
VKGAGVQRRHFRRYETIVQVLVRHGFLYVVDTLGLGPLVGAAGRLAHGRGAAGRNVDANWAERVTEVLTELGPTFVKLGQLASTRTDILPAELVAALESLQDAVPPFGFATVNRILHSAWGEEPAQVVELDPTPLAAASIGQVHTGRLPGGSAVVVKVRRPGIVPQARTDFEILANLAELAERRTEWGRRYGLTLLVEELVHTMEDEMDFTMEGRYTDQARRQASDQVLIPAVHWQWTRPDVLMVERLEGIKILTGASIRDAGLDPARLAALAVETMFRQIFVDGFFHADPHPGNVHAAADGRLIMLDWGMVGHLSPPMRTRSVDLLLGMVQRRADRVVTALLRMGVVDQAVDRDRLTRDVERLRRRYYETSLASFSLGQALTDLFGLAARYRIRIPGEYALVAKTAVTLDGLVRRLDPRGSLVEYGRRLAPELIWSRYGPQYWRDRLLDDVQRWEQVLEDLPESTERLLDRIQRGELHILLEHKNLDGIMAHWERLANRLGLSWLLGAVIVGSALVLQPGRLLDLAGIPVGEYAFVAAVGLALWVVIGAIRRGRL